MSLKSHISKVLSLCTNNGVDKTKSQHLNQRNCVPVKEIRDNVGEWVLSLSVKERKILAVIVDLASRYKIVHARQDTIAAMAGCTRKHVNRTLAKWAQLGVVTLKHRGYISNITKLSTWFKNQKHLLPKLGQLVHVFFSLALLVPVDTYGEVTRREKDIYIYNNISKLDNINTQKGEIAECKNSSFSQNIDLTSRILRRNLEKLFNYDERIISSLSEKAISDLVRNRPELLKE